MNPAFFYSYFSNDHHLLNIGIQAIQIYYFGYVMMGLQFSGQSTFVALNRSKEAVFFSLFRKMIMVVPLTLWLPHFAALGVMGVFFDRTHFQFYWWDRMLHYDALYGL